MHEHRRGVSDEDVGIRAFRVRKARAAERAIERVRHALGGEWHSLTAVEVEQLERLTGELWAYAPRDEWAALRFGHLHMKHVRRALVLARELETRSRTAVDVLDDALALVRGVS